MPHRPAVVFLDEPTIGLDPLARHAVWDRLRTMRHDFGMTVLLTTHDMEKAENLCDELAILHAGRLAVSGKAIDLRMALVAHCHAERRVLALLRRNDLEGRRILGFAGLAERKKSRSRIGLPAHERAQILPSDRSRRGCRIAQAAARSDRTRLALFNRSSGSPFSAR
jgi:ABC-type multidrug transport system ATPase subunit